MTVLLDWSQISIGQTNSLPYRYYFTVRNYPVKRGDLVAIKGHSTCYYPQPLPYIKRVLGMPGDAIVVKDNYMKVAHHFVGRIRTHSKDGKPLTPLKATVVPQGYVFVASTAWDSFDSRYEEFGLVKQRHLQGKTWGFWRD